MAATVARARKKGVFQVMLPAMVEAMQRAHFEMGNTGPVTCIGEVNKLHVNDVIDVLTKHSIMVGSGSGFRFPGPELMLMVAKGHALPFDKEKGMFYLPSELIKSFLKECEKIYQMQYFQEMVADLDKNTKFYVLEDCPFRLSCEKSKL